MKHIAEFRDPQLSASLKRKINTLNKKLDRRVRLMEVCGTHTVAMFRHGIRALLPDNVGVIAGPGCPVCVTSQQDIDTAIALSEQPDTIVTTFGDMLKVPGSRGSLQQFRGHGADVRVVYSTLDALELARKHPDKQIVHIAVGFETTIPTVAAAVKRAAAEKIKNFYLFCAHKIVPPALSALVQSPDTRIDGLILPGHVSAIIGVAPYRFLAQDHQLPGVVSGFEAIDMLQCIIMLLEQIIAHEPAIENSYTRVVPEAGNPLARKLIDDVFEISDADWRGIGVIPQSGLKLRAKYQQFDIQKKLTLNIPAPKKNACRCGEVLQGILEPTGCPLFDKTCNPLTPVGPCMVSSEGACAAYHRYQERH